jgi:hypothetical protein
VRTVFERQLFTAAKLDDDALERLVVGHVAVRQEQTHAPCDGFAALEAALQHAERTLLSLHCVLDDVAFEEQLPGGRRGDLRVGRSGDPDGQNGKNKRKPGEKCHRQYPWLPEGRNPREI